jgi:hypothetical protein
MKKLPFVFPMLLRKRNVLFLFHLQLLSPFQLSMLFPTRSFLFLASFSHVLTSAFRAQPIMLAKKHYACAQHVCG